VAADIAEAIAGSAGEGLAAKADGAQFWPVEVQSAGLELVFEKGVVEVDVMGNEGGVVEPFVYNRRYFIEIGGIGYGIVGDAGEGLDVTGDGHTGVDKGLIALNFPIPIV
jgi:hypothetical protein